MIIGLTGYARSGKDTVAGVLVKDFGFERIAFADPIRDLLYELNPKVNGIYLREMVEENGWEITKSQIEVRRLLQDLGIGARKIFGSTFWVERAMFKMSLDKNYVITDVRFRNEADSIKRLPSKIWRVKRTGVDAVNNHVSEHDMDHYPVDYTLINEGPIEYVSVLVHEQMDLLGAKS